jgi:murein DD-endopeptidase MepM/ murein hydrolase activator NlpD
MRRFGNRVTGGRSHVAAGVAALRYGLRPTILAVLLLGSAAVSGPVTAAGVPARSADGRCLAALWSPPVDGPIVDPFRPPPNPYGPGNRGIEYGTIGGDPVRAVAAGEVTFAGQVGGNRFVVVQHEGDLRSTYGYLAGSQVAAGQSVQQGDRIATAEAGFHLTARRSGTYIDPGPLMAPVCYVVRLVPVPPPGVLRPINS